ncbi:unnamed protein product [Ceratitis capitata]|uniref:(Mediterranean fruit fly) hypothetical protein n=1 Tax=Ceratitis capitata TaxID=7213 RepID=A0A811V9A1_CERCA|nr:unnamed protein product [Ceratitis capitata]
MQHYRVVPHCIQCNGLQSKAVNNEKKTNSNFPLLNTALQSQLFLHFNTSPTPRQQQHCQRLKCYNINDNSKSLHMHIPPRTCRMRHNCVAFVTGSGGSNGSSNNNKLFIEPKCMACIYALQQQRQASIVTTNTPLFVPPAAYLSTHLRPHQMSASLHRFCFTDYTVEIVHPEMCMLLPLLAISFAVTAIVIAATAFKQQ